jgi:hypothetical protein
MESITAEAVELETQPLALLWADQVPASMAPCGWKEAARGRCRIATDITR